MNEAVIRVKFDSLSKCLLRIEEDCPSTQEALLKEFRVQDSIVLELQRAVQVCVDISLHILSEGSQVMPDSMKKTFTALQRMKVIDAQTAENMGKAVSFRNIAVHAYQDIDYGIVFSICTKHLDDFRAFARQVMAFIGERRASETP